MSEENVEVIRRGWEAYCVITRVRQEGKGTHGGAPVAIDVWMVSTFRDGKIARFEFFADEDAARKAAGLRPPAPIRDRRPKPRRCRAGVPRSRR